MLPPILRIRLAAALMLAATLSVQAADLPMNREQVRALDHENPSWESVRAHLPDPATATAAQLELAADLLRARRFVADAMDYYEYSIQRGGDKVTLYNKLGISALELRYIAAAKTYFQQSLKLQKKHADGWNNLGATEYLAKNYDAAISNYKKAIKFDKRSATYHSNLATAYFEKKDFESGRKEYAIALRIDPELMQHHSSIGIAARMLSPQDHARFCYEMARLYAKQGNEENMLHFLTMASEAGFDVLQQMTWDDVLSRYRKDPRVLLLARNAHEIRNNMAVAAAPPLPPEATKH